MQTAICKLRCLATLVGFLSALLGFVALVALVRFAGLHGSGSLGLESKALKPYRPSMPKLAITFVFRGFGLFGFLARFCLASVYYFGRSVHRAHHFFTTAQS